MRKDSFILYTDQKEIFDYLTDEEAGKVIKCIYNYMETREITGVDERLKLVVIPIKQAIDKNTKKWEETKKKRSEAGKMGMNNRWKNKEENITKITNDNNVIKDITKITNDNNVTDDITKITNVTVNDNVNVNVSDNVNVNDNVNVINNNINNKECEYVTQKGIKCSKQAKLRVDGKYYCGQHSRIELQKYGFNIEINKDNNKIYFVNEEINKLFLDYLDLRKTMKIKNTDRAVALLVNKLNKYPDDIKKSMLEESIEKSWRSVYPPKNFKPQEELPTWFNKNNEVEVVTEEQQKEMEDLFSKWKE